MSSTAKDVKKQIKIVKDVKEKVSNTISNITNRFVFEWGTGLGLGSSIKGVEVSTTFGSGKKNGQSYTYRKNTASVGEQGVTITSEDGKDAYLNLFIFPWDTVKNQYDVDISGINSTDIKLLSFSDDGTVTLRLSLYFVIGADITLGYHYGDEE